MSKAQATSGSNATGTASAIDVEAQLNQLAMSDGVKPLFEAVKKHIAENVAPIAEEFERLGENRKDRWSWAPG